MRSLYKSIKFFVPLICSISLVGCDKYLEITPKGYTLLTTVDNYNQYLNDQAVYELYAADYLVAPTDVRDLTIISAVPIYDNEIAYAWYDQWEGGIVSLWKEHYEAISTYNTVILGVADATNGTEQQKKALKAEALLGRAFEYFYLVNEYGKTYDSATAAQDLAVPLVVSDDVAVPIPRRSSVKEVYDFIVNDVNNALPDLPMSNSTNRYRGSRAAGYSLLARTYFYARNYSKASEYAGLALNENPTQGIVDYTTMTAVNQILPLAIRTDALYARAMWRVMEPSLPHLKSFNTADKRLNFFYSPVGNYTFTQRGRVQYAFGGQGTKNYENLGTSIAEMVLIIGEAAARSNNLSEALNRLDEVRKNRIPAASYTRFESTDKEEVLDELLLERKHELGFNTLRWFDMRRLNFEGRMPTITRLSANGTVVATLEPSSPRYTFQIPLFVLKFNPGMEQNP